MPSLSLNKHKKLALKTMLVRRPKKNFLISVAFQDILFFNLLLIEVTLFYIMQVSWIYYISTSIYTAQCSPLKI